MRNICLLFVFLTACSPAPQSNSDIPQHKPGYLYPDENGITIPEDYHVAWPIETWGFIDGKKIKVNSETRILRMLNEEKMEYEFVVYSGHKFLVWKDENDKCINKIINNQWCD